MSMDSLAARLPPNDKEAERAVLGSLLRDNRTIAQTVLMLQPGDFYQDAHQRIYQTILHLHEQSGAAVDLVTLAQALHARGWLDDVGGYAAVGALHDAAPVASNVAHYARIVADKSKLRRLIYAATEILALAHAESQPADDVVEHAERAVLDVAQMGARGAAELIGPAVDEYLDDIDKRANATAGQLPGLATGLTDLDAITGGLEGGTLMVAAARPSVGKTAVAIAIARDLVLNQNKTILFCSLEQTRKEIAGRMLAATAGIDGHVLKYAAFNAEECERLSTARQLLYPLPFWVDDASRQSMLRIAANARRIKAQHGLALVLVDYLQLIEPEDRRAVRQEQVAGISRRLKELAKELQAPVIALCQLNRESEARQGGRPRLSDIRESGAIEQDSDIVMLLHKPAEKANILECIVAKHRNGPVGEFEVFFDRKRQEFRNIDTPFAREQA